MGGNALKNTFTRRYQKDEYFSLFDETVPYLVDCERIQRFDLIPAYREKESFGDMDILYSTYEDKHLSVEDVKQMFSPNEVYKNGDVISFDYKELQIDLIHSPSVEFDYAISYFSYNDLGNLVGKLAHQLGLKHGHNGLRLPLRDENNVFADVVLTYDIKKTLLLLGLDVQTFEKGFDNLDQVFQYVSSSRLYNPDLYKLENLNNIARVRDRKRDTYKKFLEFGQTYTGPKADKIVDKKVVLPLVFSFFPEAEVEFKYVMANLAMKQMVRQKFNGDLVSELTGLKDKELGMFMGDLKKDVFFSPEMIVYQSTEEIEKRIKEFYTK